MGALIEPFSVAVHATRRADIGAASSALIFGAGTVGLLCAAICRVQSLDVAIADIQGDRVQFALEHGFANRGYTIPSKDCQAIDQKLRFAKEIAITAMHVDGISSEFDVVFECTGAEICTQAAIYVSKGGRQDARKLTVAGYPTRWKGRHCWYRISCSDHSTCCSCVERSGYQGNISLC